MKEYKAEFADHALMMSSCPKMQYWCNNTLLYNWMISMAHNSAGDNILNGLYEAKTVREKP